jgi:hypothetical protein
MIRLHGSHLQKAAVAATYSAFEAVFSGTPVADQQQAAVEAHLTEAVQTNVNALMAKSNRHLQVLR